MTKRMLESVRVVAVLLLCLVSTSLSQVDWSEDIGNQKWEKYGQERLARLLDRKLNGKVAKNIILFIGDGMGPTTVTAGRIAKGQFADRNGEEEVTNMENLNHVAMSKTYNIDAQTPDSAGTATAMLTGVKTRIGAVGVNGYSTDCKSSQSAKLANMFDWSKSACKSTGLVTTTSLTDATPAAAYSHSANRYWQSFDNITFTQDLYDQGCRDIASQFVDKSPFFNVVLAGGRKHFMRKEDGDFTEKANGTRVDGRNLIDEWKHGMCNRSARHRFIWNASDLHCLRANQYDHVLGLFSHSDLAYEVDRAAKNVETLEPHLSEMTAKAIELLSVNQNGYFLLVEGGRIDKAHHESKAKKALNEFIELDKAIGKALEMVSLEETLLIVTADHSHVFTLGGYAFRGNPIFGITYTNELNYTLNNLTYTPLLYGNGPGYQGVPRTYNLTSEQTSQNDYVQESAVPLELETHGGEDVAIYASGPMAHLFDGTVEQNYIAHVMAYSACIGPYNLTMRPDCLTRRGV